MQLRPCGASDKNDGPVAPSNRLCEVDILRGFAVFAMVLWNFKSGSIGSYQVMGMLDYCAEKLIAFLDFENTAHLIFAFLFGWGFAMQMQKPGKPDAVWIRRLSALFIFGAIHCFFWYRPDFIHIYAYLGFFLLFFNRLPERVLLILAIVMMGAPVLGEIVLWKIIPHEYIYGGGLYRSLRPENIMHASYSDLVIMRIGEFIREKLLLKGHLRNMDILSSFLLGIWAFRRGVFQEPSKNRRLLYTVSWLSIAVALIGALWIYVLRSAAGLENHDSAFFSEFHYWLSLQNRPDVTENLVKLYTAQALTLFYISTIFQLMRVERLKKLFIPLRPIGRMALSNYFFHSLVGTTIFYGYGLGLYKKIGMAPGMMIAIALFSFQVFASRWWLARFRFGPVEWVWRSVTYWRFQPMVTT